MEPFLAQIMIFGGNFAPRGWAFCDGQLLPIASYSALFSILGTTYGGDGRTTFGLPDLRGRAPIHEGHGIGLSNYKLGEKGGVESVTLNTSQIPSHSHTASVHVADPVGRGEGTNSPINTYLAEGGNYATAKNAVMANDATTINNTGGNLSHENRQPFLAMNYIIALQGIFPSRS